MKVYDIISESVKVDEAPVGMIKRGMQKLASKVPGDIGRRASGAIKSGGEANRVKSELVAHMGEIGVGRNQLTPAQLGSFLAKVGYDQNFKSILKTVRAPLTPANQPLTGKEVDQIILKATQGAAASSSSNVQRGAYAAPVDKKVAGNFTSKRKQPLPKNLVNAVGSLTPQQKAALAAMLGNP